MAKLGLFHSLSLSSEMFSSGLEFLGGVEDTERPADR